MAAALAAVTAACSSSGAAANPGSIRLAFLWQIKGESSFAIQDFQQGAELAVNDINAKGGVNGARISWQRYPTDPTNPAQQISQVLKALETKPTAAFGPPVETPSEKTFSQYGIPEMATDGQINTEYSPSNPDTCRCKFWNGPGAADYSQALIDFAVQKLGARKVGYLHTNDSFNQTWAVIVKQQLASAGATVFAERSFPVNATDLTNQVLAMRGADAILYLGYENPGAVVINQAAQNGINVPILGYTVFYPILSEGLIHADAMKNVYGATSCNIYGSGLPATTQKFLDEFRKVYGVAATEHAAITYDAVQIVAQAIRNTGSTKSSEIIKNLETATFKNSVCGATYKSDAKHNMSHQIYIHSFASGSPKVVQRVTVQPAG
ncbi:MAG TPA: ABC transporter substrate-binding protein [Acidimicrobiales bacterium]|nr:ABC transporter substrate-binding protein [Acidimicrobiales bacterium]